MNNPAIVRIDERDSRVVDALRAERALFDFYDLDYEARSVSVDDYGINLRVLEAGSGPPVVLIAGGSGEAIQWVPMMAAMPGHRIIAINRPGGGLSDAIDHRHVNVRTLATRSLTAVLDAYGLDRVPLAANSMGGLWALWLALDEPERVSEMVQFGCPALVLGTSAPMPMRMLSIARINQLFFRAFRPKDPAQVRKTLGMLGCSEDARAAIPEPLVDAMFRMFSLPTYRLAWLSLMEAMLTPRGAASEYVVGPAEIAAIDQPAMFGWGDNDPFGGVDVGHQVARLMPNAELQVISGSHVPYIDNPEDCARLALNFLRRFDMPSLIPESATQRAG